MTKIEMVRNLVTQSQREANDCLEHEREDINVEETTNHVDFCQEILDLLE
jgi:hypothetical protein